VKVSYKDVVILILLVSQIVLVFHITSKTDNNPDYLVVDNIEDVEVDTLNNTLYNSNVNSNFTKEEDIDDNRSPYTGINNSDIPPYPKRDNSTIRHLSLDQLFLDLSYSNVTTPLHTVENGEGIIKTYRKDGRTINFDVRNYKINLDNPPWYLKVLKEKRPFKYGIYYKYTYIRRAGNNTSVNYCYYRSIGDYHIIMGFDKEDDFVRDMWLRWNEHIESIQ